MRLSLLVFVFTLQISGILGKKDVVPKFTNQQEVRDALRTIPENQQLNVPIVTVKAEESGLPINFTLSDITYFRIGTQSGIITLKSPWDYEADRANWQLKLTIFAKDSEDETGSLDNIEITLENVNDTPPKFRETEKSVKLFENTPVGQIIMDLEVTDADGSANDQLSVKCIPESWLPLGQTTCDMFNLNIVNVSNKFWNGRISLASPLNYEAKKGYSIYLIAEDGVNSREQDYQVIVLDVNDSPPVFIYAEDSDILEGEPVNTFIDYVKAIDTDANMTRAIRYELVGDDEALTHFNLDDTSGFITNKMILDYDTKQDSPFILVIKARELLDNNTGELGDDSTTTAETTIRIWLIDQNDLCPEFFTPLQTVDVEENTIQNAAVAKVTVEDKDTYPENRQFRVRLTGGQGAFKLNTEESSNSAVIFVQVANSNLLDYETATNDFTLIITAEDRGPGNLRCSGSTVLEIRLKDVNDITPKFIKDDQRIEVYEDVNGGTSVTTIKAEDPETGPFGEDGFLFSITDFDTGENEPELFQIDRNTGVVTVKDCPTPGEAPCLDYETKRRHSLFVKVEDNYGNDRTLSKETELVIYVKDRNDNPPVWEIDDYIAYIEEGTRDPNLIVKATDKDEMSVIAYSLLVNTEDARYWTIDSTTGAVMAINNIYMNNTGGGSGRFVFNAQATDGEQEVTSTITIIVLDTINEPPRFTDLSRTVAIRENTTGGTCFTEMTVTDADSPSSGNGQVVISISAGTFGRFVAGPTTLKDNVGWIASICTASDAVFDYNLRNQYVLDLRARDKSADTKTGTSTLTVLILDVNNKDPYFDPPTKSAEVSENAPVYTEVTRVLAFDGDLENDLVISFGSPIIARNPSGGSVADPALYQDLFTISESGVVSTNQRLDRDTVSSMEFPLVVVDQKASPQQTGTGSLYIRILEYNDQAPQFTQPLYNFTVKEELPPNSFVDSLEATDEDDQIARYELTVNPENLFKINGQTGVLTVWGRLDYETRHNVTLQARAWDTGTPQLSNTTTVFIEILNINDNVPQFTQNDYEIDLLEHSRRTDAVSSVSATDRDEGDFGVVRYTTNDTYFRVDNITGEIFLQPNSNLDREAFSTYTFQVTAYDSPLNASVRLKSSAPVYVILGDINDNCPRFDQSFYKGRIIETADTEDQVLEVFAGDMDDGFNRTIKFTIDAATVRPSDGVDLFSIRSIQTGEIQSGRIEVEKSLRDRAGTYNFTVIASDQNGENRTGDMCSTRVAVSIEVQEAVNDAPEWILPPTRNFSIDLLESQYRGMLIYDCKARDRNSGKEGIIDYYFNVGQRLRSTTAEFRINIVTGVISARVVYDREQVSSYVLTVVAKDQGTPSASSETVLIVNILDVNDNDPEFPMRDGETIPYRFFIPEGQTPNQVGVIGVLSATDRDSDHRNNKVYYRIVAGNDDGLFDLNRESGALRLNPRNSNGLDREAKSIYFMDVLAYNDVNDDTVIRHRRRRSTNPSLVTVSVTVTDTNDTPPKFDSSDYYGCVPLDAPFGQSILEVKATDQDVGQALFMNYSKISESTGDYFEIESLLGIVRNRKLLFDIGSRVPVLRIQVNDNGVEGNTAETGVQIFVTDEGNEVKLVVDQPSADVRYYKDQLIRAMINTSSPNPIHYVCIREIRDHSGKDGSISYTMSDVSLSAVTHEDGEYKFYSKNQLQSILSSQLPNLESLHVKSVEVESEEDELSLSEDPVLAIFIIAMLLIFLAIILFCLACCLIRNSKKKKMKKLRAEEHRPVETVMHQPAPEVGPNVNPVYDNKGFDEGNEYAIVHKKGPVPEAVAAPIVPVMVPVVEADPILEVPDQEPELTIVTHPIMAEEQPEMLPPPDDFFHSEPEVVFSPEPEVMAVPPSDPEPVIETVIMTEVDSDGDDYHIPEAAQVQSSLDDEIDVEFGNLEDPPSPPRSESPPSPTEEGYRIEGNVL